MLKHVLLILMMVNGQLFAAVPVSPEKIVIAHRGASGYLPEHTLEAKVLAHAQGADYLEQDVVMTRDNQLVVLHDLTLDRVTDVADVYPDRTREDGLHYVIDFTLSELRQLTVNEGRTTVGGISVQNFPERFPSGKSRFGIHTLAEEIELIQGLNQTLNREAGIYVEIKSPWFHHREGKDLSLAVLQVLKQYAYDSVDDKIFLQTFDFDELKRIHEELLPALDMNLPLVQLIARNEWRETMSRDAQGNLVPYDYNWMHSPEGMREIGRYADGIGPSMDMIIASDSQPENPVISELVGNAHAAGMVVHPYTFRLDSGRIPAYAGDFDNLLELFYFQADVDGIFTDFPDRAVQFLRDR